MAKRPTSKAEARAQRRHRHRTATVHRRKVHLDSVRADINVTPLVDVCLVLLIIFMVVAEMLARGKDVQLPQAKNHKINVDKNEAMVVMDASGNLYRERKPAKDLDDLKSLIEEYWKTDKAGEDRNIFIKADAKLTWGQVRPLILKMSELSQTLQLATQQKPEK